MKKEKLIRRIRFFTDFDLAAHREYLEDMSAKGLFFVKRSGVLYTFRRGEPERQRYAVDLFSKSTSVGGGFINRETAEYIESCRECGWEHVDTEGPMQYFVAAGDDATPIHTDPQIHLSVIRKSMRVWLACCLILVATGVFGIWSTFYRSLPTTLIAMGDATLLHMIALLFVAGTLLRYLLFILRNNKRAAEGEELRFSSGKAVRLMERFVVAFVAAGVVMFAACFTQSALGGLIGVGIVVAALGIVHGISKWYGRRVQYVEVESERCINLKHENFAKETDETDSRRLANALGKLPKSRMVVLSILVILAVTGMICTGVMFAVDADGKDSKGCLEYYDPVDETNVVQYVSSDAIPVTFQDLGIKKGGILPEQGEYVGSETYGKRYRSLFGTVLDCSETGYSNVGETSYLEYNIAHCHFDWVRDSILKEYKADGLFDDGGEAIDITEKEGSLWNADLVYGESDGAYNARLVIRDKTLLYIESDRLEYTKEDISNITDELKDELK